MTILAHARFKPPIPAYEAGKLRIMIHAPITRISQPVSMRDWPSQVMRDERLSLPGYSDVATSRTNVFFGAGAVCPFLTFAFAVLTTIFPPAAVNARTSWSIETSQAARSILATRG